MVEKLKFRWFYIIGALFIALNGLFIYNEFYWFNLLPIGLLLIGLALFSLDKLMLFIVVCTPLSITMDQLEFDVALILPTEPLMFGAMLVFLLKVFYEGKYDSKVMRHPITWVVFAQLAWILITAITSEKPLVSFKFLLSRMWFVISFYFIIVQFFKKYKEIKLFMWLYILPLVVVIIYTIIHHATYGFAEKPGHWVMQPFFKDHTSYGAIMAMYFPFLVGQFFSKRIEMNTKILIGFVVGVFVVGLVLSYTRAAWLSLVGVFVLALIYKYRIKFSTVAALAFSVLILFFSFQLEISQKLEKNRQDSSDDLAEHVQSMSNVATDASNLERLNRWSSAWKMFKERPVFGWGPGTYMFLYAPYQHSSDLTIISTNFGDGGNAHSEYLGPLAEQGVLGMVLMIVLLVIVIYRATYCYMALQNSELKLLLLIVLLGLITYFTHGILNNFLDTDKASVPFWGFISIIVVIDIYRESLLDSQENSITKQ